MEWSVALFVRGSERESKLLEKGKDKWLIGLRRHMDESELRLAHEVGLGTNFKKQYNNCLGKKYQAP